MKKLLAAAVVIASVVGSVAMANDLSTSVVIKNVGDCSPTPTSGNGMYCPDTEGNKPDCRIGYKPAPRYCHSGSGWVQCGWVCEFDTFTGGA